MIDDFFKYDENSGLITYNYEGINYEFQISNIKSAVVNIDKGIILIINENNRQEELVGYSIYGKFLFLTAIPEHYKFWYLSPIDLRIACTGKDEFAEESGRSGWWFKINVANGEITKDCWAY
jgi:hypothetical protein